AAAEALAGLLQQLLDRLRRRGRHRSRRRLRGGRWCGRREMAGRLGTRARDPGRRELDPSHQVLVRLVDALEERLQLPFQIDELRRVVGVGMIELGETDERLLDLAARGSLRYAQHLAMTRALHQLVVFHDLFANATADTWRCCRRGLDA